MNIIEKAVEQMDEETARKALSQLSDEDINRAINYATAEMVVPHLEDVRERAHTEDPPPNQIRQELESLPDDQREAIFYDTLDELVATLITLRERPREGLEELKTMLRDPYTTEALLLIFHNETHIDEEYTQQLKDFTAEHLYWVGAMVFPEMYEEWEVEEVMGKFDLEADPGGAVPGG